MTHCHMNPRCVTGPQSKWLIHVKPLMCEMTHSRAYSRMWQDSSTFMKWLIHKCDMTHSHSFTCVGEPQWKWKSLHFLERLVCDRQWGFVKVNGGLIQDQTRERGTTWLVQQIYKLTKLEADRLLVTLPSRPHDMNLMHHVTYSVWAHTE